MIQTYPIHFTWPKCPEYPEILGKIVVFSDGATTLELPNGSGELMRERERITEHVQVSCGTTIGVDHLFVALLQLDTVASKYRFLYNLNLPYLPYGRADRAFGDSQACGLEIFVDSLKWASRIESMDIHNVNAAKDLGFKNMTVVSQADQSELIPTWNKLAKRVQYQSVVVMAPDEGAEHRAYDFRKWLKRSIINGNLNNYLITGDKARNAQGHITDYRIAGPSPEGKEVIVVDDICDGGGTFILAAEQLRAAGATKVHLLITHGIFSKGLDSLRGLVDTISCVNLIGGYVTPEEIEEFNN